MVQKPTAPMEDDEDAPKEGEEGAEPVAAGRSLPPFLLKALEKITNFGNKINDFIWSREPHRWPTIVTGFVVVMLMSLGTWQLMRHEEKNVLIHQIKEAAAQAPEDLRTKIPQDDKAWNALEYRTVDVQGTWLNVHQFKLIPRTYEGQVGYHLVLPLKLPDNQIIFVNRGFVPDNARILPPQEGKVVAVQGILRIPEAHKNWATPENVPSRRVWTWADLAAMRHEIGVNSAAPVLLYETRNTAQETYPIGGQFPVPSHNRHRQYAFTWFALAIAFMGVWMIASSPKEKLKPVEENPAANDDERMNDPVARRGMYPEATD